MQTIGKKDWVDNLTFKEAHDLVISWIIKLRQKNVLSKTDPKIIYNYVLEGINPYFPFYSNISQVFKFSQKDNQNINIIRNKVLHVIAGSLKSHFVFFEKQEITYEPQVFIIPNVNNMSEPLVGICYQLKNNKYIISSEVPLNFDDSKVLNQYNVVLGVDSFKWFHLKLWSKNRDEIESFDSFFKKEKISHAKNLEELNKVGTVINVPVDLKDLIKPTGISWNPILKTWYVPKGYDMSTINELLESLIQKVKH